MHLFFSRKNILRILQNISGIFQYFPLHIAIIKIVMRNIVHSHFCFLKNTSPVESKAIIVFFFFLYQNRNMYNVTYVYCIK